MFKSSSNNENYPQIILTADDANAHTNGLLNARIAFRVGDDPANKYT